MILHKHHDLVADQLNRYLNAEKRAVLRVFENLWDKYAAPTRSLEAARQQTDTELKGFLTKLNYLR